MFIVDVIPIERGIQKDSLRYFSPVSLTPGSLVSVPLRNKEVPALVTDSVPASEMKTTIRNLDYELKKIKNTQSHQLLHPAFIESCIELAKQNATSAGAVVYALTPQQILSDPPDLSSNPSPSLHTPKTSSTTVTALQAENQTQLKALVNFIESTLDRKESVYIVSPTVAHMKAIKDTLAGNFSEQLFNIDSSLTKTKQLKAFKEASEAEKPIVLAVTAQFLSLPRQDVGAIVVVGESSSSYKMIERPLIDRREFFEVLADNLNTPLLLMDTVLQLNTQWRTSRDIDTHEDYKRTYSDTSGNSTLVDMKQYKQTDSKKGARVFSDEAVEVLRDTQDNHRKTIVMVARKGRKPFTVCEDCGEILRAPETDYPLVLATKNDRRVYIDRSTGKTYSANVTCQNCQSWKLSALGIGIELVRDILAKEMSNVTLVEIGTNTTKQEKIL